MTSNQDNPENCIWISLPNIPSPLQVKNCNDPQSIWFYSFTSTSIPMTAIAAKLKPPSNQQFGLTKLKSKSSILNEIFFLLDSPIEKYNLSRFLIPHRSRGILISKNMLLKLLLRYTETLSVKSGILRNAIDNIELGKPTQTVTDELIFSTISILKLFWDECYILKNLNYDRLKNIKIKYNNQLTLENLSSILDKLLHAKNESSKLDMIYPIVEQIFDMLSIIGKSNIELDEISKYTLYLIFSCLLNKIIFSQNVIFNAICMQPKNLAFSIWSSRSNLWDVIYGIEYLKNTDIHLWKKMLDLTKPIKNGKFKNLNTSFVVKISVGIPFSVMRCISISDKYDIIVDRVSNFKDNIRQEEEGYCIEEKLDGERCVLHIWRENDKIMTRFYSRGHIVQSWYGSFVGDQTGIFTKYMKKEWFEGIENLILDGEMITYDSKKDRLLGFQDVKTCSEMMNKSLIENEDLTNLIIYNKLLIYDILYQNGESLQLTTLRERKDILNKLFLNSSGLSEFKFIEKHNWKTGYNASDLTNAMKKIIDKQSEGLVIKHWKSFYFVGKHSSQWIKLKPHYLKDFIDDLDVIILAKEGSNFICGLYGGEDNDNDDVYKHWYVSFCLLRFGLDNDTMREINDKTNGHWIEYEKYKSDIEMHENFIRFGRLKPHFWIHPENSIIITIKAKSLITLTPGIENRFVLDTTLRHPYCTSVRHDKQYFECDTIQIYNEKVAAQGKKNAFEENEDRYNNYKRTKRLTKMDIALRNVNSNFVTTIVKKDEIFKGFTFCVKTDCIMNGEWKQISEINGILESHGGKIINDPKQGLGVRLLIIADRNTMTVDLLKKEYNIFRFKWCEDCIRTNDIVKLDPSHCLFVDDEIKNLTMKNIDRFGCNYTIKYNEKGLWANSNIENVSEENFRANDEQLKALQLFYNDKNVFVLGYDETNTVEREILEMQIEIHGGKITDDAKGADFIVIKSSYEEAGKYGIPVYTSREVFDRCGYDNVDSVSV